MATSNSNGSQTAVISTEHTLATITTSGSFVIAIDANAMELGDVIKIKVKLKVRSVGTTRLAYEYVYANVQPTPVILSIPVASTNEIVFTLTQTEGTGRAFPWEIWEL